MSESRAYLSPSIPVKLAAKPDPLLLFDADEQGRVESQKAEQVSRVQHAAGECHANLFFGFFFDGTKKNYELPDVSKSHSNAVRFYDCFPGRSTAGVLRNDSDWQDSKVFSSCISRYYLQSY